jgi:hypothetical protein
VKYVPPYGREIEGDAAQYINGNPVEGIQGSIPPANAFEHPMREIVGVIQKNRVTPAADDLLQLVKTIRSQRVNYVNDTGSVNNLSVAVDPPLESYTEGLILRVKIRETNTDAVSLDAGAGRAPVKRINGSAPVAGDLPANGIAEIVWDGTAWQLINFFGRYIQAEGVPPEPPPPPTEITNNYYYNIPYAVDTGPANLITVSFTGGLYGGRSLQAGDAILVKINTTNTGSTIIRIDGNAHVPDTVVMANGAGPLLQGDNFKNDVKLMVFDGAAFWLTPNTVITADIVLNVPSQYGTVDAALAAIRRKVIAANATVYVNLAPGIYGSIYVEHPQSDRIVISGSMKAGYGGPPSFNELATDWATNINMLRARYAVEIQCPANPPKRGAIVNGGPGQLRIQTLLITGPGYSGSGAVGVFADVNHSIHCNNVAVVYCDIGFYGGGFMYLYNCTVCNNFGYGVLATGPGGAGGASNNASANSIAGFQCNQNAQLALSYCNSKANGSLGFGAGDASQMTLLSCGSYGNIHYDMYSSVVSELLCMSCAFTSASPQPGYLGNYGAVLIAI